MPNREVGGYYTSQSNPIGTRKYMAKVGLHSAGAHSSSVNEVTVADILTSNDIPVGASPISGALPAHYALAGLRIQLSTGKIELKLANEFSAAIAAVTSKLWGFDVVRAPGL